MSSWAEWSHGRDRAGRPRRRPAGGAARAPAGRACWSSSRVTGVARATVTARLQRLEDAGVVTGYGPDVDVAAAGLRRAGVRHPGDRPGRAGRRARATSRRSPACSRRTPPPAAATCCAGWRRASHEALQQVLRRHQPLAAASSARPASSCCRRWCRWRTLPLLRAEAAPGRAARRRSPPTAERPGRGAQWVAAPARRLVHTSKATAASSTRPLTSMTRSLGEPIRDMPLLMHAHDQTADDGADDLADAALHGGAADERGRDGVQLEAGAGGRAGLVEPAGEDDAGQRGEHAHVHEDPEGDRLDLDAGQRRGLQVAADRVDVPAEDRPVGDQRVAERPATPSRTSTHGRFLKPGELARRRTGRTATATAILTMKHRQRLDALAVADPAAPACRHCADHDRRRPRATPRSRVNRSAPPSAPRPTLPRKPAGSRWPACGRRPGTGRCPGCRGRSGSAPRKSSMPGQGDDERRGCRSRRSRSPASAPISGADDAGSAARASGQGTSLVDHQHGRRSRR